MTRIVRRGTFRLPCAPAVALPLFTPEGERRWVDGWDPAYGSAATDEPGAVWWTALGAATTWVTTDRTAERVRYARVADNGTAGLVEVVCTADGAGTTVEVTYDLTATDPAGEVVLRHFGTGYADMLAGWERGTAALVAEAEGNRTPLTERLGHVGVEDRGGHQAP